MLLLLSVALIHVAFIHFPVICYHRSILCNFQYFLLLFLLLPLLSSIVVTPVIRCSPLSLLLTLFLLFLPLCRCRPFFLLPFLLLLSIVLCSFPLPTQRSSCSCCFAVAVCCIPVICCSPRNSLLSTFSVLFLPSCRCCPFILASWVPS